MFLIRQQIYRIFSPYKTWESTRSEQPTLSLYTNASHLISWFYFLQIWCTAPYIHIREITQCLSFCDWMISLSTISFRLVYVLTHVRIPLLRWNDIAFKAHIMYCSYIHLLMDNWFAWLWIYMSLRLCCLDHMVNNF